MGGNPEEGHDRTLFDKKGIFLNRVKGGLWSTWLAKILGSEAIIICLNSNL